MSYETGDDVARDLSSDIRGKTVLITGGTMGGLGAEFAATIVKHSPKLVILTARSQAIIDTTFAAIKKDTPDAPLRSILLDLLSLDDIRRAAKEINAYSETIDVLVHNAGVAGGPFVRTKEGLEPIFATNHVGPFLLTKLLLPKMRASSATPRIVSVSTFVHTQSTGFRWSDPNYLKEEEYDGYTSYKDSKVLTILFASALARRSGGKIDSYSLNPGWIHTGVQRYVPDDVKKVMGITREDGSKNTDLLGNLQQGIRAYIVAAFDTKLSNGDYVESHGRVANENVAEFAKGIDNEDKMWALSEASIGEKFELSP